MAHLECGRRRMYPTSKMGHFGRLGLGFIMSTLKVYSITFKELDAYTLFHGYYLDVRYVDNNGKI